MPSIVGLKILTVADAKWLRPVALMYRKDGYLSPLGRRFIDILKAMANETAVGNK